MADPDGTLPVGTLAYDTGRQRIGVVMEVYGSRYILRPVHGGCEWDVVREACRPATVGDQIAPGLAARNLRSSRGGL
ncbi:hypothetical protein ABZ714_17690 [Streptomyces sp. NPDC006798]|uniref:hypothetical protein n=1 Tax=Streptomyces sp. NPDC006798 TaxID=3155462 RepID=UPI0033F8FBE1